MQRSWRTTVDRTVLVCIVFAIVTMTLPTVDSVGSSTTYPWLVILLAIQVGVTGVCVVAIRTGGSPRQSAVAIAISWIAIPATTFLLTGADLPAYASHSLATNAIHLVHLTAIGLTIRPSRGLAMILATGPVGLVALTTATNLSLEEAVDRWILATTSSITVLVILSYMRGAASRADRLTARTRAEAATARMSTNAEHARDEGRRLIHDEIITALRSIELESPPATIERDARRALAVFASRPVSPSDITAELQRTTQAQIVSTGPGWRSTPPQRVTDALRAAAAEALRNIDRHAGVSEASVCVDESANSWLLTISDRGDGFLPGREPGFGIRESILARMDDVGGSATVSSSPSGTSVQLRWPAGTGSPAPQLTHERPRPPARVYTLTALPSVLANAYFSIRFPGELPWTGLVLWAALTLLLFTLAAYLGQRSPAFGQPVLTWWAAAGFTVPICALVYAGVAAQADGALFSAESWVVGYGSVGVVLVAFCAGIRMTLVAISGLLVTTGFATLTDPSLGLLDPVGAYLTILVNGGTAIIAAITIRRASQAIAHALEIQNAQDEASEWRAELTAARERFVARLGLDVIPFLESVVNGSATRPAQTAANLGAQCRDELNLYEPLPETVRTVARSARARGVTLSIRSTARGVVIPDQAWSALETILRAASRQQVVTMLPPSHEGDPVRIACVPPLPSDAATHGLPGELRNDPLRTVILVWPAPPTTPPTPRRSP